MKRNAFYQCSLVTSVIAGAVLSLGKPTGAQTSELALQNIEAMANIETIASSESAGYPMIGYDCCVAYTTGSGQVYWTVMTGYIAW